MLHEAVTRCTVPKMFAWRSPGGGPCTTEGRMVASVQRCCCPHSSNALCSASTLLLRSHACILIDSRCQSSNSTLRQHCCPQGTCKASCTFGVFACPGDTVEQRMVHARP